MGFMRLRPGLDTQTRTPTPTRNGLPSTGVAAHFERIRFDRVSACASLPLSRLVLHVMSHRSSFTRTACVNTVTITSTSSAAHVMENGEDGVSVGLDERRLLSSWSHNGCKQVAHIWRISEKSGKQAHKFDHDPEFSLLMTITHPVHINVGAENANTYVHRLI